MSSLLRSVTKRASREDGSVIILTAVGMLVLMGVVGLGLDSGTLMHHRRVLQTAADAGAMAGGSEIYRGKTTMIQTSARDATKSNGFDDVVPGIDVVVSWPPVSGPYALNTMFVEVVVSQPAPTFFMRLFGWATVTIPARAVAGVGATNQGCIFVLEESDSDAMNYESNAILNSDCGLVVNSKNPAAYRGESNSNVNVESAAITGNFLLESSSQLNITGDPPTAMVAVPAQPDPLGYLTPPLFGGCDHINKTLDATAPVTLLPGVYCGGIRLKNDTIVDVTETEADAISGMYIIAGGGLTLEGKSVLRGNGVTFFFTEVPGYDYKPLDVQSTSVMNLKAPTYGPYKGILFYQDPNAGSEGDIHRFQSSSTHTLEGALYFPTQIVQFESSTVLSTAVAYTNLVCRVLNGHSNSVLNFNSDYSGLGMQGPLKRLVLVE